MQARHLNNRSRRRGAFRPLLAVVLVIALHGSISVASADVRMTATLDRDSVIVGESVQLTLSFEGGSPQEISDLPTVDGLQRTSGVSRSFQTTSTPQGTATVLSYGMTLRAVKQGEFVIPPFKAKVDGQEITTQPLRLKVLASDPSQPSPALAESPVFLWPVLPDKEFYIGEARLIELRLYVRSDISGVDQFNLPLEGDGLTFSGLVDRGRMQRRVGNSSFTVFPLFVAVTPLKTGTLTMSSSKGNLVVNAGPMGIMSQRVGLTLDPITLRVRSLPTNQAPANFSGAVGNYTMDLTASPTNVASGDPITLRVQISGRGALDSITLPEQTEWRDFKTYPATAKVDPTNPLGVEGVKTFEKVVVPQSSDLKELPSFSFSFFDPEQNSYKTLTHPPIPITVRPGGQATLSFATGVRTGQEEAQSQDIVPIKQHLGAIARVEPPLIQQPWFLALQSVPVLAFFSAVVWRKRNETLANNPRLRRQRKVAQIIREGLADLRPFAAENKSEEFFATLFRLLQEQLGERLNLPASAITESVVDDHLRSRGVSTDTLAGLQDLFQTCNLARYAPIKSSQELAALIPKIESVLDQLKGLKA